MKVLICGGKRVLAYLYKRTGTVILGIPELTEDLLA
jgi:hypothetical protein